MVRRAFPETLFLGRDKRYKTVAAQIPRNGAWARITYPGRNFQRENIENRSFKPTLVAIVWMKAPILYVFSQILLRCEAVCRHKPG